MSKNKNDVFENLILFGWNGCGKTTYLNKIIKKAEKEKEINLFKFNKESLKDSYDGKTNTFKKEILKNEKALSTQNEEEKPPIDQSEYSKYIQKLNSSNSNNENKLIENELKIYSKTKEINKFFDIETFIELYGNEIKLDEAPSGVKKFISLKYEINDEKIKNSKNKKILIIIDEFENHLHPWWINIICKLIDEWIKVDNIYVMLSTHSPLVLENLKDHMEHFKTVEKIDDEFQVKEISEENLLQEFNEYVLKVWGKDFTLDNFIKLLNKTKPRLAFELSKIFFSQNTEILFVEGITDKIFFEKRTEKIIINIYGNHNIPYTLFLVKYAGIDLSKISFILDGDGNLKNENTLQFKTQKFLNNKNIKNFYFEKDIEQDLYGKEQKIEESYEKFNLAFKWREKKEEEIVWAEELKEILQKTNLNSNEK